MHSCLLLLIPVLVCSTATAATITPTLLTWELADPWTHSAEETD